MADNRVNCFLCSRQELSQLAGGDGIAFYECPSCNRQYAQATNGPLTYRWGHPISLVLYGFSGTQVSPAGNAAEFLEAYAVRVAEALSGNRTPEEVSVLSHEIEIELAQPTHRVSDILSTGATEQGCRILLRLVVNALGKQRFVDGNADTY